MLPSPVCAKPRPISVRSLAESSSPSDDEPPPRPEQGGISLSPYPYVEESLPNPGRLTAGCRVDL